MTKFNPENHDKLSYGECLEPAMAITDQADADQYKAAYIKYTEQFLVNGKSDSGLTAEQIVNQNLGYFAGYYSDATRARVEKLFKCYHPVFGPIAENGSPTAKEAFEMGKALGKKI